MIDERSSRTAAAVREVGADWALLTTVETVAYSTGYAAPIEIGLSPFAGGPITALVDSTGTSAIVSTNLELAAAQLSRAGTVRDYEGLGPFRQAPYSLNYVEAVRALVAEVGAGGVFAIEPRTFPDALRQALGDVTTGYVSIDPALDRARSCKTDDEVVLLRRCAEITAVGQHAAVEAVKPGRRELEIFADIRAAMEVEAGQRVPLTGDLLSGRERTAQAMGWPTARIVESGDPVICDLAPRIDGYWGDSCNSLVPGIPSDGFDHLYRAVARALETAAEILRPGITAGRVDRQIRSVIEAEGFKNPLHIGHGIGTSSHEYPRLVPEETCVLEEGMVLMVEPGAYDPKFGGVRLEWMFMVTADGNEVLSPFEHVRSTLEV